MTATASQMAAEVDGRRLELLDSPLPLLFLEATPGAGVRTLLRRWVDADDCPEIRVLLFGDRMSVDGPSLLRLVWQQVTSALGQPAGHSTVPDRDVLPEFLAAVKSLHRPLAIAVARADFLEPATFAALLGVLTPGAEVRLVVSAFDASSLMREARSTHVPFTRLSDADLALTVDEVQAVAGRHGHTLTTEEAADLHRTTRGLPGVVRDVLDGDLDVGLANPDAVIGEYLFSVGAERWPSPLVSFVGSLVHVPRFSAPEASVITGVMHPHRLMARMVALGLGEMNIRADFRQRVFSWHEPARRTVIGYLESPAPDEALLRRTLHAAQENFDRALVSATFVDLGLLAEAEFDLRDWLWEALPNGPDPVWAGLAGISPWDLVDFPRLLCVRMRIDPQGAGALAVQQASRRVHQMMADDASPDPWQRVGSLAVAIELARVGRDMTAFADGVARARQLVTDLLGGDYAGAVRTQAASDLLVIAEAVFRLGNIAAAAEYCQAARDVIDAGPARLDPWGDRAAFASRVGVLAARERGAPDPADAATALAGEQFRRRDPDVVAHALARMWAAVDRDDLAAADEHCAAALERVARPDDWPSVWYPRMWLAAIRGGSPADASSPSPDTAPRASP